MKSILLSLSGTVLLFLIMASCRKETSFEFNVSKGTLKSGATGNCLPSVVNGTYIQDSALTSANFIDVLVDVTSAGRYVVKSDEVNGFSFRGEGVADSTGFQTIRLAGKGKPVSSGVCDFDITYGASTCKISITVAGSGPDSAEYTYATAASLCPNVAFAGTYTVGDALTDSNTMTVDVNVTKTGHYNLNIPTSNGISFSGSGSFSSTGVKQVLLKGAGTPVTAGTFDVAINSCKYPLTVTAARNTPDAHYTINCNSTIVTGTYMEGVAMMPANTIKITASVISAGKYAISSPVVNGVSFSATGTFAAASPTPQDIVLRANGTPVTKGSFDFPIKGDSSACTLHATFAAAPAKAVFALSGAPNSCSTPAINGSYTKGLALNATNTIILKVSVVTAGPYSISTNTVNGMSFSGSGTFSGTGQQSITLTGSGTPVNAGSSTFTPQFGSSACSFDVTVAQPAVADGVFTCTIDGVFASFNDRAGFSQVNLAGMSSLSLEGYSSPPNGAYVPELQLSIDNLYGTPVKAGSYVVNGALQGYVMAVEYDQVNPDNSVTPWTNETNIVPPATNPAFTIVITSISATRIKGTFSGKVTDASQGGTQTKTITGGIFDLPVM